ncbi:hypothetical protein Zm00014a_032414 [Zea mays]|jgi:hypothetical protein|uniref:Uncharacterized protein n=2 Tax=Zea mays TaxID=4577 RepID=B6SIU8_MAIZE|nr:uncharacterized protein LOC100274767 [Zea mays]ACG24781.1 hypothetical protein [Zea mays]ACG26470.1 hypothetical protein [Zea mays]ACG34615.1 hypothetical protein [Zea mays]ONM08762.1 hypothetical protein ZEAMMB73_Zm00001d033846 [Zea mays]PWZ52860.1 hypothetical protein Zm00014a_032414 [Zea mays]|eukprot:NP_001142527.1 uncharacterized protein LOC100274767 [Zea mays]
MAPSASMLFLSYHQLHRPTEVGTPPPPPRREAAAPGGFWRRMSVSSVLSPALLQWRPEGEATLHERDAGEEIKSSAPADADKELESKFEEALRLSCWSS